MDVKSADSSKKGDFKSRSQPRLLTPAQAAVTSKPAPHKPTLIRPLELFIAIACVVLVAGSLFFAFNKIPNAQQTPQHVPVQQSQDSSDGVRSMTVDEAQQSYIHYLESQSRLAKTLQENAAALKQDLSAAKSRMFASEERAERAEKILADHVTVCVKFIFFCVAFVTFPKLLMQVLIHTSKAFVSLLKCCFCLRSLAFVHLS
jgi:hypothetical protein